MIIWDSKKLCNEKVVIDSFSVSVKFMLDGQKSVVFGPNSPLLRNDFLGGAFRHFFTFLFPLWCVGDDFNVIRKSSKKLGGSSLTSSMKDFDSFIRDCELLDPSLRNAPLT